MVVTVQFQHLLRALNDIGQFGRAVFLSSAGSIASIISLFGSAAVKRISLMNRRPTRWISVGE